MDYKKLLNKTIEITIKAAENIRNEREKENNTRYDTKSHNSFVTNVDKNTEQYIIDNLNKILPDAGFLAEESGETNPNSEFLWIIDPLDGTTNYIHSIYPVAISIALMHNQKPVVGVIHEVGLDEIFYASKDDKAYLNNKQITVSSINKVSQSLLATGFPYFDYERMEQYIKLMREFMHQSHGLRRLGSAATDLAYVACGRFDGFFEYSLNPWDVAAGAFIVEQAGGKVTDFSGNNNYIYGKEILATNSYIFDQMLNYVTKYMNV